MIFAARALTQQEQSKQLATLNITPALQLKVTLRFVIQYQHWRVKLNQFYWKNKLLTMKGNLVTLV